MKTDLLSRTLRYAACVAAVACTAQVQPAQAQDPLANVVISGYGYVQYENQDAGEDGFALGSFNPIFLYRHSDRVLFEAELELEVEDDGETEVELEYGQIDYLLTDDITLVAGRFILPLGVFNEKLHPQWINKLPTFPLPYAGAGGHHDAIVPFNDIGVQVRGSHGGNGGPVFTYALYVVNGPSAEEHAEEEHDEGDEHAEEEHDEGGEHAEEEHDEGGEAGELSFTSGSNHNDELSYGGRVGVFVPLQDTGDLEVGVSAQTGPWSEDGELDWTGVVIDGAVHVGPHFEVRGEYLWTEVESTHSDSNPTGAWVQPALKLAVLESDVGLLNNSELVFRWSHVDKDDHLGDSDSYALGVLYYLTNTLQFKSAYEFIESDDPDLDDRLVLQLAFGF